MAVAVVRMRGCLPLFSVPAHGLTDPCTKLLCTVQGIEKEVALQSAPDSLLRDETDEACG